MLAVEIGEFELFLYQAVLTLAVITAFMLFLKLEKLKDQVKKDNSTDRHLDKILEYADKGHLVKPVDMKSNPLAWIICDLREFLGATEEGQKYFQDFQEKYQETDDIPWKDILNLERGSIDEE